MSNIAEKLEWKSASIVPICLLNGKRYILLGRESTGYIEKQHNWDTFGGGREAIDKTPKDTAIREFDEETMGIFGSIEFIRENLLPVHAKIKSTEHYIYIIELDYSPVIVETYNRLLARMRGCFRTKKESVNGREVSSLYLPTCPTGMFEKTMLAWYPVERVLNSPDMLRPHSEKSLPVIFHKALKYMTQETLKK
jgi:hypothetical protein